MFIHLCQREFNYKAWMFFTVWGFYTHIFAMTMGSVTTLKLRHVQKDVKKRAMDPKDLVEKSNSIFKAWKWHAMSQEMVFHFNV